MKETNLKLIFVVTAAMVFSGFSVRAADTASVRHESGEITWVDLNQGKLQLRSDVSPGKGDIFEYRITQNETRVTDPTDKKLLTVEDLWPGQQVKIDVINGSEEKIVQKVVVNRNKKVYLQQAYGEVKEIDEAGTLVVAERSKTGVADRVLSYFIFEPKTLVVMQSPSRKPVELLVKPGDIVKVEFVVKNKKQQAQYITLYAPTVVSTTTTTIITTR